MKAIILLNTVFTTILPLQHSSVFSSTAWRQAVQWDSPWRTRCVSAFGDTAVFTVLFFAVGLLLISALEVEGRDVPVLLTSSQGTGSGLDSGQGHLFLKKLETGVILLCLFRRSKK